MFKLLERLKLALYTEYLGKCPPAQARYQIIKRENIRGQRILDAGCGKGGFSLPLSTNNFVIGIDISVERVKEAKKRARFYPNAQFVVADVCHLPFRNDSFTKIVSLEVIEHMDTHQGRKMLRKLQRVMSQEAELILTTPNKERRNIIPYVCTSSRDHIHEYTREELLHLLEEEGFQYECDETCRTVGLFLFELETLFEKYAGQYIAAVCHLIYLPLVKLDKIGAGTSFFVRAKLKGK